MMRRVSSSAMAKMRKKAEWGGDMMLMTMKGSRGMHGFVSIFQRVGYSGKRSFSTVDQALPVGKEFGDWLAGCDE
jgi:hypothetical protein